jgi:lysyl-tRNA synthetase class 2
LSNSYQDDQIYLARKANSLHLRAGLISGIRHFFREHDFLEIETPVRIPSPAPEEYIEAIPSDGWFLQTSPELCMKRMLAAGYPRIFQICKCFRAEERGSRHLPEFTMLEWYVAQFDYQQLMNQCESLLCSVWKDMGRNPNLVRQNKNIHLGPPWERITVADAFKKFAPADMRVALEADRFDEMMVEYIEPNLGLNRPTFLYDYPAELAALARLKKDDRNIGERFELYIGGLELANGFSELTDANEQRKRFEEALCKREAKNRTRYDMPEKFLQALPGMPEAAGIALGIDRLSMILVDTASIDDIVAFPPERL